MGESLSEYSNELSPTVVYLNLVVTLQLCMWLIAVFTEKTISVQVTTTQQELSLVECMWSTELNTAVWIITTMHMATVNLSFISFKPDHI